MQLSQDFKGGEAEVWGVHVALGNAMMHVNEHVVVIIVLPHLYTVAKDQEETVGNFFHLEKNEGEITNN